MEDSKVYIKVNVPLVSCTLYLSSRHNAYELLWLFTKGPAKIKNYISGEEQFEFDPSILFEGYSHDRGTKRLGSGHALGDHRDTTAIDNDDLFKAGIQSLLQAEKRRRRRRK